MKYQSRADLLIAAGESIKMQMNAGVNEPVAKYMGKITACDELNYTNPQLCEYEFPLAVVEGKPVFVGDELWNVPNNFKFVAKASNNTGIWDKELSAGIISMGGLYADVSWNQPKPKTVMVELLLEDAEFAWHALGDMSQTHNRIATACRKALEKA